MERYVILYNVRSAHNVGSIFRTADGAGVSKIFLTGYTPAPIDRFGREDESMRKTALGATTSVAWEQCESIETLIHRIQATGVEVVAVEQTEGACDYRTWRQTKNVAFIFGNEIEGVPKEVLKAADTVLEIPMYGMKESLNVSVSSGVVLFGTLPR